MARSWSSVTGLSMKPLCVRAPRRIKSSDLASSIMGPPKQAGTVAKLYRAVERSAGSRRRGRLPEGNLGLEQFEFAFHSGEHGIPVFSGGLAEQPGRRI